MATVSTGTTITLDITGFTAEVVSIDKFAYDRPWYDTTNMGGGVVPNSVGLFGGALLQPASVARGTMELHVWIDPAQFVPLNSGPTTATISYPDGSNWNLTGVFVTDWQAEARTEDIVAGTLTLEVGTSTRV